MKDSVEGETAGTKRSHEEASLSRKGSSSSLHSEMASCQAERRTPVDQVQLESQSVVAAEKGVEDFLLVDFAFRFSTSTKTAS